MVPWSSGAKLPSLIMDYVMCMWWARIGYLWSILGKSQKIETEKVCPLDVKYLSNSRYKTLPIGRSDKFLEGLKVHIKVVKDFWMYFRVQTCPASVRINLVFLQSQYLFALEHIIHIRQCTHSKSPHFYFEENCDGPGVAYVVYPKMIENMQLQIITLAVLKQY